MKQNPSTKILKISFKLLKVVLLVSLLLILAPWLLVFYLLVGILDVSRNKPLNFDIIQRYFTGNGLLTWLFAPFNLFLDLLSFKNKGVYQLEDFPQDYQKEISSLLNDINTHRELIRSEISSRLSEIERGMLFFKWYGDNIESSLSLPCFHKKYHFIKTIGVSTFNKQTATSVHFGPLRITLRLLYNLSPTAQGDVYIQVGDKKYHWKDNPLFIFDDTLQHQSVNYSDQIRHCMFVDIIRPSKFTALLNVILKATKFATIKINGMFYKRWVFLK